MDSARPTNGERFTVFARLMHWIMAVMTLAMIFIGVIMVTSVSHRDLLLAIHRPLGTAILVFVVVRFGYRLFHRPPPHPPTMHPWDRLAATASEYLFYALLFAQPLVGWALLSAAGTPIVLFDGVRLPAIAPHSTTVYAVLRDAHTVLAYLLFLVFVAHLCGVLFHSMILRDGVLDRMAFWRPARAVQEPAPDAARAVPPLERRGG
ncbi:cytochrome b [Pseudonocardia sp. MH-G8]|uniref:cytochrome b n=1 Tax=Pseudonocardia sp. MH-G8 TaxID=1854588 RepID=UPI000BA0576D|nr:cytochrome b/b6 domain-containing protein [Pseudonocardia sp. MH-G8]OZM76758.1 cytochrome B [Pseudonocardia sp. MH-G8]